MQALTFRLTRHFRKHDAESGQILLIVVLLLVVVLTVGLSLAARSITNVRQTAEEDSSQRAFSAAEAGIEIALSGGENTIERSFDDNTKFKVTKSAITATDIFLNDGNSNAQNEPVDIWLAPYPTYNPPYNGIVTLYWGNPASTIPCDHAAFEIAILTGTSITTPQMTHYAYDPCTTRGNSFVNSNIRNGPHTIGESEYAYALTLPRINPGLLMRLIPLYHDTPIAVQTTGTAFPVQGTIIESVGSSGETQRKIVVVRENPKIPLEMFPFVLFTPDTLP